MEAIPTDQICHFNQALIVGELVTEPERKTMPSGEDVLNFSLTVRTAGEATTSVPFEWFKPPKRVDRWKLGSTIVAKGSVRRRFYRSGAVTGSSTAITVQNAELHGRRVGVVRLLEGGAGELEDVVAMLG